MSQTETLLLFVLGFCVALFVVLLFGRGVWSLLGGWAGWREQRRIPAAIRELQAERDSLKAEKAIMIQKLEASLSDMRMRMAEQMAEVARNRNRLLDLGTTMKEREVTIADQKSELDTRTAQIAALETQIAENVKAINIAYAKMAQREDEHQKMQTVLKESQSTLSIRDDIIRTFVDEKTILRERVSASTTPEKSTAFASMNAALAIRHEAMDAPPPRDPFESKDTSGNPLLDFNAVEPTEHDLEKDAENVDRSVSNVLSLAERVRSLQNNVKKG